MKSLFQQSVFIAACVFCGGSIAFAEVTGDEAYALLQDGNARFVAGETIAYHEDAARRKETADNGQKPFVSVLTCSDSRVPAEIVFDQGIGDVFVVRVAGNVADTDEIGTLEYGVGHLNTPLLVVLGHTKCGAVTAVCEKAEVHGSIPQLVDNIIPAVAKAQAAFPDLQGKALAPEAVKFNVYQAMADILSRSEEVRHLIKSQKLMVIGAIYDISSGKVEWLGGHPEQASFFANDGAHTPKDDSAHKTKDDGAHTAQKEPTHTPEKAAAPAHH
jgi:carbonic anhydrase